MNYNFIISYLLCMEILFYVFYAMFYRKTIYFLLFNFFNYSIIHTKNRQYIIHNNIVVQI